MDGCDNGGGVAKDRVDQTKDNQQKHSPNRDGRGREHEERTRRENQFCQMVDSWFGTTDRDTVMASHGNREGLYTTDAEEARRDRCCSLSLAQVLAQEETTFGDPQKGTTKGGWKEEYGSQAIASRYTSKQLKERRERDAPVAATRPQEPS
jgi:hypothetical protein